MSGRDRLADLRARTARAADEMRAHGPLTAERAEAGRRWIALAVELADLERALAEGRDPATVPPADPDAVSVSAVWAHGRATVRKGAGTASYTTITDTRVVCGATPATAGGLAEARRRLRGRAGGRPPGQTTIIDDDQLRPALEAMDRERVRPTRETLAARAGFTHDELRGWLRATGRTFADLLADLRARPPR